jgi:light-regulated signal transduction histidine kinase (bacteriophytochrome)
MRQADVDLNGLVAEVRAEIDRTSGTRQIAWRIEPLPHVRGDALMLRQVFINLLDNAVKYTRTRSMAEVHVGTCGEENGQLIVFVRDNGVGFEMKYADKLFGAFQRLHRPDEFEGNGIGLANVQRIVLRHGGRVWAEAAVNVGATFYFTLPRVDAGPPGFLPRFPP